MHVNAERSIGEWGVRQVDVPSYAMSKTLKSGTFEEVVGRTMEALKEEGFGVLTEIDVQDTLKEKLDIDFREYLILGACNPPLAHRALESEPFIGLLLPCNVIVFERDDGGVEVAAILPSEMFSIVDNSQLEPIVVEVQELLQRVLEQV